MARKTNLTLLLSPEERQTLESWQRSTTIRAGLAKRGRIILLLSEGVPISEVSRRVGIRRRFIYKWAKRFQEKRLCGLSDKPGRGRGPFFPSQWDCSELAHKLIEEGVVSSISTETVRRVLSHHKLKPWRHHLWLSPKHPRDAAFYEAVTEIIDLYSRPLAPHEVVLCVDEKTSLQPRPRICATKPAQPGNIPNHVEHEYRRDGALNLFAAFNTRTGHVTGHCFGRKRQKEFICFLEHLGQTTPTEITLIHIVCDNVSVHHGKEVKKWLEKHPRFQFHFTPVHCSWINQVEQWFSILQRKRFRIADFASKEEMHKMIMQFTSEWNRYAHPFNWSSKSVAKVMADTPLKLAA
jgi:transposase